MNILKIALISVILIVHLLIVNMVVAQDSYPCVLHTDYRAYADCLVERKWEGQLWVHNELIMRESRWNYNAQNPVSTAFGIYQFLDSTWQTVNCEKTIDPKEQVRCGLKYIEQRYGDPQKALDFHDRNNWY